MDLEEVLIVCEVAYVVIVVMGFGVDVSVDVEGIEVDVGGRLTILTWR